jgi:hypothetical protein
MKLKKKRIEVYKFAINRNRTNWVARVNQNRGVWKEIKLRNYSKYGIMDIYFQNQDVYSYTEQKGIPFWHSKCRNALYFILNLPSKLAQAVTILASIGRSRFRIPFRSSIILRGFLWYSSGTSTELQDIYWIILSVWVILRRPQFLKLYSAWDELVNN